MNRHKFYALALLLALAAPVVLILSVIAARAGDTVSLAPVYHDIVNPTLLDLLTGLVSIILSWAFYLTAKVAPSFIGTALQQRSQAYLSQILWEGVQAAMHSVENAEQVYNSVEVKGAIQRYAANYAVSHAGKYVDHLGLGPDQLAQKALAYIPAAPVVITSAITSQDLPPVPGAKADLH